MVTPRWQLSISSQHISCLLPQCARGALSTHVKKFDPESLYEPLSLLNLKLWTHIWSTNTNFWPPLPLQWTFWSSWSEWTFTLGDLRGGGSIGLETIFFCHGQKRNYWSRTSQRVRGAIKNINHAAQILDSESKNIITLAPTVKI